MTDSVESEAQLKVQLNAHIELGKANLAALSDAEIAKLAREAEIGDSHGLLIKYELEHLKKFAELIALRAVAAEREACAEIAADEDHIVDVPGYYTQLGDAKATACKIEKAIRARSKSYA